jgi:hypothetical protein
MRSKRGQRTPQPPGFSLGRAISDIPYVNARAEWDQYWSYRVRAILFVSGATLIPPPGFFFRGMSGEEKARARPSPRFSLGRAVARVRAAAARGSSNRA